VSNNSLPETGSTGPRPAGPPSGRDAWIVRLIEMTDEDGSFDPLGARHHALFLDRGPTLLVTFEEAGAVRARPDGGMPTGFALAEAQGWSQLAIMAEGETWFRDLAVYRHFDRLGDDAFFEDFDRVLFYGAGMGGYAAAAYSVAAPGATVLTLSPRATLDPAVAGWDPRHRAARRLNFTDRYGYAPDMVEAAGRAFVVHDPAERLDAMHAALFHKPWVTPLRARWMGTRLDLVLERIEALEPILLAAMEGRLTPALFAQAIRNRRRFNPYLRHMLALAQAAGKPAREVMICRSVTARLRAPAFRTRLDELTGQRLP
jgi:hypothetical protein